MTRQQAEQARLEARRDQTYTTWTRRRADKIAQRDGGLAEFLHAIAELEAEISEQRAEISEQRAQPR